MSDYNMIEFNHALDGLIVYKNIKRDAALNKLKDIVFILLDGQDEENSLRKARSGYFELISLLVDNAEMHGLSGNIFKKHILRLFLNDENLFSLACERKEMNDKSTLYDYTLADMRRLCDMLDFDIEELVRNLGQGENITKYVANSSAAESYTEQLEMQNSPVNMLNSLKFFYMSMGSGVIGRYRMLRFNGESVTGVKNYDRSALNDIVGYEYQKAKLIENTMAFLSGAPANNVLLIGSRGTGKSSCVKALANEYCESGLRLLEITKDQLTELPKILKLIENRGKKFIIFIDDLSFDEFEVQYKYMKSLLEGSVERRPDNVLFYATSNRRHLIQEKWSDKDGAVFDDGEIHASDTTNEKLSLADRFGLTITFPKPSPKEYLNIVSELAKKEKMYVTDDFLKENAKEWELNQKGLSGRTARQFVNHMICELGKN